MTAIGRPTRFEPEMCEQAHNYCLLGATNHDLADFLHVSTSTIDRWIAERADFRDAVQRGRVAADARVARSLYDRALGYDRTVERPLVVDGEVKPFAFTVHYPGNVQACMFWLRARRRHTWNEAAQAGLAGQESAGAPRAGLGHVALLEAASESARRREAAARHGAAPDGAARDEVAA